MDAWEEALAVTKIKSNKFREDNIQNFINHDSNTDLRLRMALISNSKAPVATTNDPIDMKQVLNQNTGSVAISYMGGVSGTGPAGSTEPQTSEYQIQNNTYNFKDRKFNYVTTSTDANTKLASPYIWTGYNADKESTWCGFNYIPLQNSIAILGNKESGQPLILNYIASDPTVLLPALKPGEIAISGYGHNYIHWGQSDKITIHCDSKQNKIDYDDPNYLSNNKTNLKKNAADCEIDIQINANDRLIKITAIEDGKPNDTYNLYNSDTRKPNGNQFTKIIISPTDIDIVTHGDIDNDGVGTTRINISNEGINFEVNSNNQQTFYEQTESKINLKHIDEDNSIIVTQNIENNKVYRKVENLKDPEKYTEEIMDSESYTIHTKDFKVESDTYTVNGNILKLQSEDIIDIKTAKGAHPDGTPIHEETYSKGDRAGQKKKFAINIEGCEVKIKADTGIHGSILES